jgi:glycosyltransferase involved in cell wall biosynthesis
MPDGSVLRVVALATYPAEGASTRFRISQFLGPLRARGVQVELLPFFGAKTFAHLYDKRYLPRTALALGWSVLRRIAQLPRLRRADAIFVQREAALFGPPLIEWCATRLFRRRMVLDLDDPTWLEQDSPIYGRLRRWLKPRGNTDWLIDHAAMVICGNEAIADYVRRRGAPATVMQTIVDTAVFSERTEHEEKVPVIGWIGSHSTFPYFESIIPVLESLAAEHRFRVRLVGCGRERVTIRGVDVEVLPWALEREVADFHAIDIGVYPLPNDRWAEGKSGLKAIEYLSVGIPYVASSIGVLAEIGEPGVTHFVADTPDEWRGALARLLQDPALRRTMGRNGRAYATAHYSIDELAARIAEILRGTGV